MKLSRSTLRVCPWGRRFLDPAQMRAISCLTAVLVVGHVLTYADRDEARFGGSSNGAATAIIERFLATEAPLTSYRAFRTLEATTRGGRMRARLTAWTSVDPVQGFQYSIVDEEGSGIIHRKALRPALDAERSLRQAGDLGKGALTTANYDFRPLGSAEDGLVRIGLHPKRRDTLLIEGTMLLTADDGDLRMVEGLLVKRPSVWTRRVEIVRRYGRIGGVRVPLSMESTANILLVGSSTFSMAYEYESINGALVSGIGLPPPDRRVEAR
jgi:hypothetical protein